MSSDENPTQRLSLIFDSLSRLSELHYQQQQLQQPHLQQHHLLQMQQNPHQKLTSESSSSMASPSSSGSSGLSACSSNGGAGVIHTPINTAGSVNNQSSRILMGSRSTPNSPRLMPKRNRPPVITPRPNAAMIANPSLAALDDGAPWPHFLSLTEHLDVHQVNNYNQGPPEINWQERCLELQLELHRSKNQASRIREILREKVKILIVFILQN